MHQPRTNLDHESIGAATHRNRTRSGKGRAIVDVVLGGVVSLASSFAFAQTMPQGAVDRAVTQSNIDSTICIPGYSRSHRPDARVMGAIKKRMMRAQHPGERFSAYELDHIVPISLAGDLGASSTANLWLQPRAGEWGSDAKDKLEYVLYKMTCRHELTLIQAQRLISGDWVSAYKRYVPTHPQDRFRGGGD